MNADVIKGVLEVITALIPLIILIVAIFRSRIRPIAEPLDSPSLKIRRIVRLPVDEKIWQRKKRKLAFTLLFMVFVLCLIPVVTLDSIVYLYHLHPYDFVIFGFTMLLTAFEGFYAGRASSKFPETASDATYILFDKIEIIIDANYHYL